MVIVRTIPQSAQSDLSSLLNLLQGEANATSPGVTAVYEAPGTTDPDTGNPKEVIYVGLDSGLTSPSSFLSGFLHTVTDSMSSVQFSSTNPGPNGGTAECVTGFSPDVGTETLCGWATETTVGVLDASGRDYSPAQLAAIMRQMRPYLETAK
jgi:hypothetical protein